MKRAITYFLILALALSLCACGEKEKAEEPAAGQTAEALLSVDPETGEWTGQGGLLHPGAGDPDPLGRSHFSGLPLERGAELSVPARHRPL